MRRLLARFTAGALGVAVLAGLVLASDAPTPAVDLAPAADIGQFNPGNIISDAVFFDGDAMTADEVRAFIAVKGMNCTAGSDGTPCLKDYRQDTTTRPADAYCGTYPAAVQESAAAIITKSARACGISPKVLLVMLQKEQSLVTNTGSSLYARRYREAMGYACPDTAACDPAYNGFQNQVYSAARRYQVYKANPGNYGYRAGRTQNVLFHPNSACGSKPVYIQNQATAGLYIYTPYQPNAAALAAGYGTGDACSAYGNRNFWLYFTDWFGSTQAPGEDPSQPVGKLDSVTATTGSSVEVRGWAVDPDTTAAIDVHVYVDGRPVASTKADVQREDVVQLLPAWGAKHGFLATVPVSPGVHEVCAYAINVAAGADNPKLGCSSVDTRHLPFGNVESAVVKAGMGVVSGWTLDPDTTAPLDVHVYVNGGWGAAVKASGTRADVGAAYPGAGSAHGYQVTVPLRPGANDVCLYAINVGAGASNPEIGCRTLTLAVEPEGGVRATGGASAATVTGWAVDPETSAPIDVHVYVDDAWGAALTADKSRSDMATLYPGLGTRHGFSAKLPMSPGSHQVCVYAINVGQGTANPRIGCATVLIGVPAIGNLEEVTASGATVQVSGWALDPDTPAAIDVQLNVNGRYKSTVRADRGRPDVGAAYPASGSGHGFSTTLVLPPATYQVCAYALNVLGGTTAKPRLGCFAVKVPASVSPKGNLDEVTRSGGYLVARGWAYDPDVPTTSIDVHFYVDGRWGGLVKADQSRPDVAAAFRGAGEAHGYTGYLPVPAGRHTVCAYGIDTGRAVNPLLRCVVVTK
jgi:hypothetical protein